MRLTFLQADGLKAARNIRLAVPHLLAIHGPNGTGKTTLAQAVLLAELGYDPAMGRTLAATRKLSGGDGDIEVGLNFDTGFGIRRSFGRSGRTEVAPPQGEGTEAEKQERINLETGAFAPSFDLASMIALSAEKRRGALFALLPRELAHLAVEEYRHWVGYGDAPDLIKRAIDKLWEQKVAEASVSPTEGLASAIEFARAQHLEAEREQQKAETITADAEAEAVRQTEAATPPDGEDLAGLQVELSVVEQSLGALREKEREAERAARQRQERQERIAALDGRIAAGAELVANRLAERDAATIPSPASIQLAETALQTARERGAATDLIRKEAESTAAVRREEARSAYLAAEAAATALERQADELETALQGLDSHAACPTCGSVDGLEAARATLRHNLSALEEEIAEATKKSEDARRASEAAREAFDAASLARDNTRIESDGVVAKLSAELSNLRTQAEAARTITQQIRQAEELLGQLKEEHARLTAEASQAPVAADPDLAGRIEAAESKASDLRQKIRALTDAAEAIGRAGAARERADRQRAELATITARATALKGLYQGLQKYRGHVVRQMVAPVETMANALLQRIDPAKEFAFLFEREGKDEFDFGFIENGTFRGYDAASTGEDAFLAVVFVAALIAAVKPAWRVLLVDNAESIDDQRRRDLMEALARVADQFDNVILLGCSPFDEVEGWVVMETADIAGAALMAGAA